jgi:hypothetical protein
MFSTLHHSTILQFFTLVAYTAFFSVKTSQFLPRYSLRFLFQYLSFRVLFYLIAVLILIYLEQKILFLQKVAGSHEIRSKEDEI